MKQLLIIPILLLMVLPGVSAGDTSPAERFHLGYYSRGSYNPVTITFSVDKAGHCEYHSKDRSTGASEKFSARLSRNELVTLKSKLLNEYKFFSLPDYQKPGHRIMDASTSYLTVTISDKTRRIGGYAVDTIGPHESVFSYIQAMIHTLREKHAGGQ
ncbi:MAG TPA: hypothetical protein PK253_16210 [Spirochaetota bacterium]|nr:hypothetical protein [Spirochaetota bacterium]HPQ54797.1 hypothetical protein [Spirochaetota bacterium]